jgi:hypothetical protein
MMRNIATTLYKQGPLGMWWGRWDLNPGSHTPQACILNQARRRPQMTRRPNQSKVINILIKLKASGLADSAINHLCAYLKSFESMQKFYFSCIGHLVLSFTRCGCIRP